MPQGFDFERSYKRHLHEPDPSRRIAPRRDMRIPDAKSAAGIYADYFHWARAQDPALTPKEIERGYFAMLKGQKGKEIYGLPTLPSKAIPMSDRVRKAVHVAEAAMDRKDPSKILRRMGEFGANLREIERGGEVEIEGELQYRLGDSVSLGDPVASFTGFHSHKEANPLAVFFSGQDHKSSADRMESFGHPYQLLKGSDREWNLTNGDMPPSFYRLVDEGPGQKSPWLTPKLLPTDPDYPESGLPPLDLDQPPAAA